MRIALLLGLLASLVATISTVETPSVALAAGVYDVKSYGALGDGRHDDAPALNRAIATANRAGGGTVLLPAGTYRSAGSLHMMSNVTIRLEAGATLRGAKYGYDPPEPNPYSRYQDTGHSHFHDAMI
jgi:polygalacturonase